MGASNSTQSDKSQRRKNKFFRKNGSQARHEHNPNNFNRNPNHGSRTTTPPFTDVRIIYNNQSEHVDYGQVPYRSQQALVNSHQLNNFPDFENQSNNFGFSNVENDTIPNNYPQSYPENEWSNTPYNLDDYHVEHITEQSYSTEQYVSRPHSASSYRPNGMANQSPAMVRRHSLHNDYDPPNFNQYSSMQNINRHGSWDNKSIYTSDSNIYQINNTYRRNYDQIQYHGWPATAQRWKSDQNLQPRARLKGVKRHSLDEEFYNSDPWVNRYNTKSLSQGNLSQGFNRNVDDSYVGPRVKRKQEDSYGSNYSLSTDHYNVTRSSSACSYYNNKDHSYDFTADTEDYDYFNGSPNESDSKVLSILTFPSEWSSYSVNKTGYVEVLFSSPEGKSLQRYFHRTSQGKGYRLSITGIVRIENPFLHSMYLLKKEEMRARNGHVDELYLYHGTKKDLLPNICEDNLNWRLSATHRFGSGISFSPLATYSSHYCDKGVVNVMLLCKVLASNSVFGTEDMIIPPTEYGVKYDTSIKEDTSVIVKYSDHEFYPMYKIMFTKQKV